MSDVDFLSPRQNQCILTTHVEVVSRAGRETGVVSGNRIIPTDPASMTIAAQEGRIKVSGAPQDVVEDTVELDTAHSTLPRIDIIYRDASGDVIAVTGSPAVIEDPKGLADWKSYTSPTPPADIPAGVILGAVYVPPECAAITSEYIWMFAGGVGDIATSVADPGVDSRPASEKAVRDVIDGCAPASMGVTNGNSHNHYGGDGAQIDHYTLQHIGANTHTAIDAHLDDTSNPHSTTAAQVGADITVGTVHAATGKSTPVDNDELQLLDSAADYILKKLTWANLKATLLSTLHSATKKFNPVDNDELQLLDSAASYGQKVLTWWALKTTLKTYYDTLYAGLTHASRHSSGGADSIKLDDLAAPDDNTDLNASTTKHGLMAKFPNTAQTLKGDGTWITRTFGVDFPFGDGSAVLVAQAGTHRIPIASTIKKAYIRSLDTDGALKAGSVTCTVYVHDYNGAIGAPVDSFVLSSTSSYAETGLSISVAAGKFITAILSGISTVEQIVLSLELEAT